MNNLYKYFVLFLLFGFFVAQTPVKAAVVKKTTTKTVVTKKVVTKPKIVVKTKTPVKVVKKAAPAIKKSSFSAVEASKKVSAATGKQVPAGYMEALKAAQDKFMSARSKAGGNKVKLDAATQEYDDALAEAQKLLEQ